MQDLWTVLGPDGSKIVVWLVVGLAIAIAIALLLWLLMKLFGRSLNITGGGGRGQPQRLGITGAYTVDRKGRKLVILRRDNVEHLVLIGGPNDVLIEANIVRAQSARPSAARADGGEPVELLPAPATVPVAPVVPMAPPPVVARASQPPAPPPPRRDVLPEPPIVSPRAPEPAPVAVKTPEPQRLAEPGPPVAPLVAEVRAPAPLAAEVRAPAPVVAPEPQGVDEPAVKPARPASSDPRLSDMARRLQSVLQKPLTPTAKPPAQDASAQAESIPIPLPSARKPAESPPAEAPASIAKPTGSASVTQGNALPDAAAKPQPSSIDSLEEEMARLLGRADPAKT